MAYGNGNKNEGEKFVKIKDGVKAPAGFHYMPNGKLMSDADHIATYGYIEKKINYFDINTSDIDINGESRSFAVTGDDNAIFSLEIYDDDGNYYNFKTASWSSTVSKLNKIKLTKGLIVLLVILHLNYLRQLLVVLLQTEHLLLVN